MSDDLNEPGYRVEGLGESCKVEAQFRGALVSGTGLSLSPTGVSVAVSVSSARSSELPRIGESVSLTLTSDSWSGTATMQAKAVHRIDGEADLSFFGFEFLDEPDAGSAKMFNRRQAFRVRPPADGPMQVTIETATASVDGRVRDLSATGVAIEAQLSAEVELCGESSISLRMALDDAEEISVPATIRNRAVIDATTVMYGIAFEFPPDEPAIQGAIQDFVMKLQMDARRAQRDADEG